MKGKIHITTYRKYNYQVLLCSITFKNSPINRVSKFVFLLQISCSKVLEHCWTCICTEAICHKQISLLSDGPDFKRLFCFTFLFPCGIAEINGLHDYSWVEEHSCSARFVDEAVKPVLY